MCLPSIAPIQLGRCHSSLNLCAMFSHSWDFGTGMYNSAKEFQMTTVVSSTILPIVDSPLAK